MNTPQWLEAEQQRIKREARMLRVDVALGVAAVVVWCVVLAEMVIRIVR